MGQAEALLEPVRAARRIIDRPRLLRQLEQTDAQTILLVAPAGYGKTTLARQWQDSTGAAWITLTEAASDLAVLARVLGDALSPGDRAVQRLVERVLAATSRPEAQAQTLVDAISRHPDALASKWLILDDYQAIAAAQAAGSVICGLHRTRAVRVVIASRIRPTWVSPREIVYGEVMELRADDLALEPAETQQVVTSEHAAASLHEVSRGWPAVVGLAAHLQPHGLTVDTRMLTDSLYDYLADELYAKTTVTTRENLMRLAVYPVLTREQASSLLGGVPAVDAVLASGLVQEVRERVEIHPLARSFLTTKVRSSPLCAELANTGIKFAIEIGAWDDAFELVQRFNLNARIEQLITAAYEPLAMSGRFTTLEKYARWAGTHGGAPTYLLDLVEAEIARRDGDIERAVRLGLASAKSLPADHPLISRAFFIAGSAANIANHLDDALDLLTRALQHAQSPAQAAEIAWSRFLAALYLQGGKSHEAFAEFRSVAGASAGEIEQLRVLIGRQHLARVEDGLYDAKAEAAFADELMESVVDPWVRTAWGNAYGYSLFLQGRYADAHRLLSSTLAEITEFDLAFGRPHIEWTLAAVELGLRRFSRAERLLRRVERASNETGSAHLRLNCLALRARLLLVEQRPEAAERLVSTDFDQYPSRGMYGEYLATRALVQATLGKQEASRESCKSALALTKAVETPVLCAASDAIASLGTPSAADAARTLLERASLLGAWDGVVCAVRAKRSLASELGGVGQYRAELTEILRRSNDSAIAKQAGLIVDAPRLVQIPLSPREQDVMELVRLGLHNSEIASALFISSATVKVHVRHILEKLGARTRAEAVSRYAEIARGDVT